MGAPRGECLTRSQPRRSRRWPLPGSTGSASAPPGRIAKTTDKERFVVSKLMSIVLASAVALLGATTLAGAAAPKKRPTKSPTVIPVLGAAVDVPVGQFVK